VEVNLTRQVVYLARRGVVLRILDASTGKAATPTPTGNFAIVRRIDGWRQSSLALLRRPNYFWVWLYRARLNLGARLSGQPRVCAGDGPGDEPSGPLLRIGMPVSVYR
jgi:hypothetical protein